MLLLTTGGTIDVNRIDEDDIYHFTESYIPKMLNQANSTLEIEIEVLFLKDSIYTTDNDRKKILNTCKNSPDDRIIVTHGTDTMTETAKMLGEVINDKTIILVGSMVPYIGENSDALFNLGSAITAAQILDPGVYITMNGKVFLWNDVRKNQERKIFERISEN